MQNAEHSQIQLNRNVGGMNDEFMEVEESNHEGGESEDDQAQPEAKTKNNDQLRE